MSFSLTENVSVPPVWGCFSLFVCLFFVQFLPPEDRTSEGLAGPAVRVWGELVFTSTGKWEKLLKFVLPGKKGGIFLSFCVFYGFFTYWTFFCVVLLPTSSSSCRRRSFLTFRVATKRAALSSPFCRMLARSVWHFSLVFLVHFSARKCQCILLLSRQANGLPDSSPSHQHGQRLLLEVDQRLRRLGARLQAQLWRSEESLCVSACLVWLECSDCGVRCGGKELEQ